MKFLNSFFNLSDPTNIHECIKMSVVCSSHKFYRWPIKIILKTKFKNCRRSDELGAKMELSLIHAALVFDWVPLR